MNDKALVKRILQEEPDAIHTLETWIAAAAGPYRGRLGAQWEDILQEIRMELLQLFRRSAFEGKAKLKTYIWSVVNHTCIDHLRKHAAWRFTTLEALPVESGKQNSPLDRILQSDRTQKLLSILEKVSQDCQELWRRILAGQSYQHIGRQLKINEATVRVRVHRCRKKAAALRHKYGV